jgi:predicted esterase
MIIAAALLALTQPSPETSSPAAAAPATSVHQARILNLPDDAIAYIPASANARPPLLVLLHGAGRRADRMIEYLAAEADQRGIVLLAPTSSGATWDTVSSAQRPPSPDSMLANNMARRFTNSRDAARVESAIAALAKIIPVDRSQTVLGGFSDGATFAVAMGLSRNHQFSAVIAWSPGIAIETASPARRRRLFVSHGRQDRVLSFNTDCGEIVPMLQSEGAAVSFLPFNGGHEIPEIAKKAFLDAVFGPAPGMAVHPLPLTVERCMTPRLEFPSQ